jgi:hypothetical protein
MRRLIILLSLITLGCATCFVAPAAARPPLHEHISSPGPAFPVPGLCPFTIFQTTLVGEIDQTTFFDNEGNITRVHWLNKQQDAFSLNGKTLVGVPYTATVNFYYVDGVFTNAVAEGVLEKVPLPDGSTFLAAGRLALVGGGPFFQPDNGAFKNLDGFCAALSP